MNVAMIGTGYVGLVSGTCFAEIGHKVACIDLDEAKVKQLWQGLSPIYEPGLSELLTRNIENKRLTFHTDYTPVKEAQIVFLAVGTPSAADGTANLEYLFESTRMLVPYLQKGAIVVIKSTVPVGTHKEVARVLQKAGVTEFYIVNNPEFLKEGSAIDDFMRPDRVVVGHEENQRVSDVMDELYAPLVRQGNPIFHMSNLSAEVTKYASNCFLATKISFINEMARFCDRIGADIEEVRKGMISDRRIGPFFLYPGPGYGGSCFPKDVKAMMAMSKQHDTPLHVIHAAHNVNEDQKLYVFKKLERHFKGDLKGRKVAVWGAAFKPNTDDVRESPSIVMIKALVKAGASVSFYDPVASENFIKEMQTHDLKIGEHFYCEGSKYDCLNGADALLVVTDWAEFKAPDFQEVYQRLAQKVVFDARNLYATQKMIDLGFEYYAVGKKV